jgi:hypothetical protein
MATPLQTQLKTRDLDKALSVVGAKPVELALVTYYDDSGMEQTQLAVVGDNTVHLLDGKSTGFSANTTHQGRAADWLKEGIFKALGRKVKK